MTFLRAFFRLVTIGLTNLCFYSFLLISSSALALARRLVGDRRGTALWRTRIFHAWGVAMARLLGMRIEVRGRPPAPPFVMVSNHLGYVDVILLASCLRCVFVSKAEVRDWPVVGALCASVDTLFIQREVKRDIPRVVGQIGGVLAGGRGVVLFPEGTSSGGDGVLPFRPSLLATAARAGLAVHAAAISYRTPSGWPPARDVVCWWGSMTFAGHVWKLLGIPGFEARVVFAEKPLADPDRKVLAERLEREVERCLRTVV